MSRADRASHRGAGEQFQLIRGMLGRPEPRAADERPADRGEHPGVRRRRGRLVGLVEALQDRTQQAVGFAEQWRGPAGLANWVSQNGQTWPTGGRMIGIVVDPADFDSARKVREFDALILASGPPPGADATPSRDAKAGAKARPGADTARINDQGQATLGAAVFRRSEHSVAHHLAAGADPAQGPAPRSTSRNPRWNRSPARRPARP
jgi:hypothetical protein